MIIFSFCTINFNNSPCEHIFHKNAEGSFWLGKTFPFKIIFRKEKNLQNSDLIHTVTFSSKQGRRGVYALCMSSLLLSICLLPKLMTTYTARQWFSNFNSEASHPNKVVYRDVMWQSSGRSARWLRTGSWE